VEVQRCGEFTNNVSGYFLKNMGYFSTTIQNLLLTTLLKNELDVEFVSEKQM
jgi:hypothetical protein